MNNLKDLLLGALIGLSRASESKEITKSAGQALVDGLILVRILESAADRTVTYTEPENVPPNPDSENSEFSSGLPSGNHILSMIDRIHEEKALMAPDCAACQYPCGRTFDYDMAEIHEASKPLHDAKTNLLTALENLAANQAAASSKEVRQFLSDALFKISCSYEPDQLSGPLATANHYLNQYQ